MKNLIATTALALVLTAPMTNISFADGHAMATYKSESGKELYASNLIGMRIYSAEKQYDTMQPGSDVEAGSEREWDDIGEVNDIIVGRDGQVKAVLLGIGGFIGMGEKDVAVPMQQIKIVNEKDNDGFFLVVKTNKKALEAADSYQKMASMDAQNMDAQKEKDQARIEETAGMDKSKKKSQQSAELKTPKQEDAQVRTEIGRVMLTPPPVEREGYRDADQKEVSELTTEDLTGAYVYGTNDESVGEIDRLIVDNQGKIKEVVINVGGFLGLGEKPIAVTMDELKILRNEKGEDFRIHIESTQSKLEQQPEYKG